MTEAPQSSFLRYNALYHLVICRLKEFVRQPEAVFWVYIFPILMVVALGIAFRNKPVESFTIDVVASSQEVIESSLRADERIQLQVRSLDECQDRLRVGQSDLYVIGDSEPVQYVYDPTRPNSLVARAVVDDLLQRAVGRADVLPTTNVEVNEPGGRYVDFLIPGLLGMGLMGGGLFGVGFAVVELRIRKLLKRLLATPMKRTDFLASLMISRLIFMVPEIIVLVVFARYAFNVRVYGSWLDLVLLILIGAVLFSGVGLLVASRARTLESVSGLMNLIMLPMWTLSGIFFSYERFPEAVQPFIKALPLTPLIDSLRATMLEGAPIATQWPEILIMLAWTVVTFVVALAIFRWND